MVEQGGGRSAVACCVFGVVSAESPLGWVGVGRHGTFNISCNFSSSSLRETRRDHSLASVSHKATSRKVVVLSEATLQPDWPTAYWIISPSSCGTIPTESHWARWDTHSCRVVFPLVVSRPDQIFCLALNHSHWPAFTESVPLTHCPWLDAIKAMALTHCQWGDATDSLTLAHCHFVISHCHSLSSWRGRWGGLSY